MLTSGIQVAARFALLAAILGVSHQIPAKRSPLETGLVSFAYHVPEKHNLFHHPAMNKTNTMKAVVVPSEHEIIPTQIRHEWIPGHVHHHAFIPAHAHHVIIPAHAVLLTRSVHTVLVRPELQKLRYYDDDDIFRSPIGGFGVGVDIGGAGAGHGFHVAF